MKAKIFLLNLLILIGIVVLLYVIEAKPYKELQTWNNQAKVKYNLYFIKASVVKYIAMNNGKIPTTIEEVTEYLDETIVNPYNMKTINNDDIMLFKYDIPGESKDMKLNSTNARLKSVPGSIAYGYFIGFGDSLATEYGIVGFGKDSLSIYDINETTQKKESLIILYN
ncbi:hypothetical protein DRP43_00950 [candidate division TA06 bacterium]|uniref:Type II secretion system protein GspG C-terminal domain-containing protein n=1 Tax=candidate division TA06 bacterium TaxID=2250710 RepID=A0A660SNM0_UNCT6|nr:MAG: hypothetical protein DRP43_00950 [candidate division TA06 bacterium]